MQPTPAASRRVGPLIRRLVDADAALAAGVRGRAISGTTTTV
jgi:hypothetical protein